MIDNTNSFKFQRPGGLDLGIDKIEFDAVFDRGKCKLSDAFYGIKKYCGKMEEQCKAEKCS